MSASRKMSKLSINKRHKEGNHFFKGLSFSFDGYFGFKIYKAKLGRTGICDKTD